MLPQDKKWLSKMQMETIFEHLANLEFKYCLMWQIGEKQMAVVPKCIKKRYDNIYRASWLLFIYGSQRVCKRRSGKLQRCLEFIQMWQNGRFVIFILYNVVSEVLYRITHLKLASEKSMTADNITKYCGEKASILMLFFFVDMSF